MISQMNKRNMKMTTGSSGDVPGALGEPRTTGDYREKWNIQNMVKSVVWPKGMQTDPKGQKESREKETDPDESLTKKQSPLIGLLIIGSVIWFLVR